MLELVTDGFWTGTGDASPPVLVESGGHEFCPQMPTVDELVPQTVGAVEMVPQSTVVVTCE